jgi:DNA-binding FadR family transcriptional regulator
MKETPMTPETPNFDPDYVATLREVLDIAVAQIAVEHRTPATKAMMAQIIVQNAARGVTDAHELVDDAVRAGSDGAP